MEQTEKIIIYPKKRVNIVAERVTAAKTVKTDGYCGIVFYNQGTSVAYLFGTIKVIPNQAHEFNFDANEVIDTPVPVTFESGAGLVNDLAVTKIYKK